VLGLSYEATRARLRRGTLPGERRSGGWVVFLDGRPPDRPATGHDRPQSGQRPAGRPASDDRDRSGDLHPPDREVVRLDAEVTHLRDELAWFKLRLEAAEVERSEMRRLLAAQTPQRALVENATTRAEAGENRPEGVASTQSTVARWWCFWRR